MATSIKTACPFIDKEIVPDPKFNKPMKYLCGDRTTYIYYQHWDGFDHTYPCQFCGASKMRKRDVFECLNEIEWTNCGHYKNEVKKEEEKYNYD